MGNLKVHDKLDIQAGGQAEVLDEFGSGGQGTVYKLSLIHISEPTRRS